MIGVHFRGIVTGLMVILLMEGVSFGQDFTLQRSVLYGGGGIEDSSTNFKTSWVAGQISTVGLGSSSSFLHTGGFIHSSLESLATPTPTVTPGGPTATPSSTPTPTPVPIPAMGSGGMLILVALLTLLFVGLVARKRNSVP